MKAQVRCLLLALATWFAALPALAADPFTVAGVPVDATAASAIEAQTKAIADGQLRAAQILLERLTLEDERLARGLPVLTADTVGPMIRGLSVNNERRSATRYLGDVSIAFNPSAVQQLLRGAGLTMVSSQARERLVLVDGTLPSAMRAQLLSGRFGHALTPLRALSAAELDALPRPLIGADITSYAAAKGAEQVLLLTADPSGFVSARDLTLNGTDMDVVDLGSVSDLGRLVAGLERQWKQTAAVPSGSASTATVSVLYSSLQEWQRLQRAINTSAQVRDARLDAVSKDGALMTLSFGDFARLQSEMRQKGVTVEQDPALGLVIRR